MAGQSPCSPRNPHAHASRQLAPKNHGTYHLPCPHPPTPIPAKPPPTSRIRMVVNSNGGGRIPNVPYLQEAHPESTLPYERGGPPSNVQKLPNSHASPTCKELRVLQKKNPAQSNRTRPKRCTRQNVIRTQRENTSAMARGSRPLG